MKLAMLLGILAISSLPVGAQSGGVGGFGGEPIGLQQGDTGTGFQSQNVGFFPWLSVNGIYSHPLGTSIGLANSDRMGGTFSGGVGGSKAWQTSEVQAGYVGSGSYNNQSLSGAARRWRQTHVGNVGYVKQLTQQWQVSLSQVGGLSDGGYGIGSAFGASGVPGLGGGAGLGSFLGGDISGNGGFQDPNQNGLVDAEILDTRTKFSSSRASLAYRLTERLSANGTGGAGFARRGNGLSGVNAYTGGGGLNYQITQNTQIGGNYMHSNVDYVGLFGGSRYDTVQAGFQTKLTQQLQITAQGGAARLNSTFVGPVALPPDLAALLGVGSTLEVQRVSTNAVAVRVLLSYNARNSHFNAGYNRGVAPGNGVVFTSLRDSVVLGYGWKVGQKLGLSFTASYNRLSGRVGIMKVTQSAQGGTALSYKLFSSVSATAQGGYRYTTITGVRQFRELYAGFGLTWHPGDAVFTF
ncbi:outer membrane protein [Paludibaculum fermentans]|uniref:outer membrane protein n=1 Tax=Paludibaculum fermentans TaxID=1473598 RepID=UPI003EBD0A59